MAAETGIGWTDHTFNPWIGCERVSPACAHCYAATFTKNRMGLDVWGADAPRRVTTASWKNPPKWNRQAEQAGERRLVFCASLADVFEDRRDLDEPRDRLWALIEDTPALCWQLLTKRPENVAAMVPWGNSFPMNVWIGTSVENARHTWRADVLREIPAAVRFLSCEPLLGSLFTVPPAASRPGGQIAARWRAPLALDGIDWVIAGGESGPRHRPMQAEWVREVRDACLDMDIPFFFKQWGGATPKAGGKELDGREWCQIPGEAVLA